MTTATADPLRRIIEDRVEELLRFRHWYRVHRAINLDTIEAMHTVELRALVRLLRAARLQEKADTVWHASAPLPTITIPRQSDTRARVFAPVEGPRIVSVMPESADPVTAGKAYSELLAGVPEAADINGKGYHDWQGGS